MLNRRVQNLKKGTLTPEQIVQLDALGFRWYQTVPTGGGGGYR
jgi:hypothetical protein